MQSSDPFNQDYSTTLDVSGNGSVTFGPNRIGQSWTGPMTIAVKTSTAHLVPSAEAFLSGVSLGSTYVGSGDSNDIPNVTVHVGQTIRVAWTGGDPGAIATASVTCTLNRW